MLRRSVLGLAFLLLLPRGAAAQRSRPYVTLWDNFRGGFSATGPDARWFHFSAGVYVGDDGVATTGRDGLRVVPTGTHPATGEPAFTRTISQESDNGFGLPGGLDHVKWLVYMNHAASSGFPGFDAEPGRELSCSATISGRTYGTQGHPFGAGVANANDDPRLAAAALSTIDYETSMVFDFVLTNERIYASYQRLPFARTATNNYAAFSFMVPVGNRTPADRHRLRIAYDRAAGTVRWLVNGREVHRVSRIGLRLDRAYMTLDHGGVEARVAPRQLDCGMGMLTLLDAYRPTDIGLVRVSDLPYFYFNPDLGEPEPELFIDNLSLRQNRLFGQGAEIRVRRYRVSSLPTFNRNPCDDDDDGDNE
jgi:hypothetical protein